MRLRVARAFRFQPAMNFSKKLVFSGLIAATVLAAGFRGSPEKVVLEKITRDFHLGLEEMSESLAAYRGTAAALDTSARAAAALRERHRAARLQFKKIEYLLEYFDRASIRRSVNGAPLPSVVSKVPSVIPLAPAGFQPLEELVFAERPFSEKPEILRLLDQFEAEFASVRQFQEAQKITHRHVFEAMRHELVRVFTLGVTGFDTPASGQAVPEAAAVLRGLAGAMAHFRELVFARDKGLAIVLEARFAAAVQFLEQNPDFDSFDRLAFLKDHINPLFEILLETQLALGVETVEEVTDEPQPVNFRARNLFADDFLNAGFFANLRLDDPAMPQRVALGRTLFFDPVLSQNNQRACASCHQPERAFTDGLPKSRATDGDKYLPRNAPTLLNCVFSVGYFYDLRQPHLEKQVLHVVKEKDEFGTDYFEIAQKLAQSGAYRRAFGEAYPKLGTDPISAYTIGDALASYVASLRSFNSPFDRYVRGDTANLDPAAARGFNLFMGKAACGTCHFAPVFNGTVPPMYDDTETEVLAVPEVYDTLHPKLDGDLGRFDSGNPRDRAEFYKYSFKTVTVRNAALTAPYLHNGSLKTLEEVVDFYNRGGGVGMGLDVPHQTLPFDRLNLTSAEQRDLVAFIESLTDNPRTTDRPAKLPAFEQNPAWDKRKPGGEY